MQDRQVKREPFKDGFYLKEYAAFAIAAHNAHLACIKCATSILETEFFAKRYFPLLKAAIAHHPDFTPNAGQASWPQREELASFTKSDRAQKYNQAFSKCLTEYAGGIRNYFAHYLHTLKPLQLPAEDRVFCFFLEELQKKAVAVWKARHAAWRAKQSPHGEQYDSILECSQRPDFWDPLTVQRDDCTILSCEAILIFLSILLPRSRMYMLLDKVLVRGESGTETEKKRISKRELLTALSPRDGHSIRIDPERKSLTAAFTVFNHIGTRYGRLTDTDGNLLSPRPNNIDDIVASHHTVFFIKMLVAFIEGEKCLPSFEFARSYHGKPVFDQPDRELYIRHNNVAVRLRDEPRQQAVFSIHLLKLIILNLLSDKGNQTPDVDDWLKKQLRNFRSRAGQGDHSATPNSNLERMTPSFMKGEPGRPPKQACSLRKIVENRLQLLQERWFGENAETLLPHQMAYAILRAVNLMVPPENVLNSLQFREALLALTAIPYSADAVKGALPDIPRRKLNVGGQTLRGRLSGSQNINAAYGKIRSGFSEYCNEMMDLFDDQETTALRTFAARIGVQYIRKENSLEHERHKKDREQYQKHYLEKLVSIPPVLFVRQFMDDDAKNVCFGTLLQRSRYIREVREAGLWDVKTLLADGQKFRDKHKEVINRDQLLLALVQYVQERNLKAQIKTGKKKKQGNITSLFDLSEWKSSFAFRVEGGKSVVVDTAKAWKYYLRTDPAWLQKVFKTYCSEIQTDTLPFVGPPDLPRRKENTPPRSWREAEGDMEQERYILMRSLLIWEKNTGSSRAKGEEYKPFKDLVTEAALPNGDEVTSIRNAAFHGVPDKPFRDAPEPLQQIYQQERERLQKKRGEKKRKAQKN
jgi:hypothetical protein